MGDNRKPSREGGGGVGGGGSCARHFAAPSKHPRCNCSSSSEESVDFNCGCLLLSPGSPDKLKSPGPTRSSSPGRHIRFKEDVGVVRLHDTDAVRDTRMGTWMQDAMRESREKHHRWMQDDGDEEEEDEENDEDDEEAGDMSDGEGKPRARRMDSDDLVCFDDNSYVPDDAC